MMADARIRYIPKSPCEPLPIKVYHGRYVGRIVAAGNEFQYVAKGGHKGERFASIQAVKNSIEGYE
jgi:hypothetical protein